MVVWRQTPCWEPQAGWELTVHNNRCNSLLPGKERIMRITAPALITPLCMGCVAGSMKELVTFVLTDRGVASTPPNNTWAKHRRGPTLKVARLRSCLLLGPAVFIALDVTGCAVTGQGLACNGARVRRNLHILGVALNGGATEAGRPRPRRRPVHPGPRAPWHFASQSE
jgi:hypothetical protein